MYIAMNVNKYNKYPRVLESVYQDLSTVKSPYNQPHLRNFVVV